MSTPSFARSQRAALLEFYISCLVFGIAVGLFERFSGFFRLFILALAILATAYGTFSLYRFFKATDEFRMTIQRRAIEFAFIGSLVVSVALALLQTLGIRSPSPYLTPLVMIGLWSIGLFISSRRFE
jgi:hypothetical protein